MIPFRKSIGFRILGISFILLALPLLVDSFILVERRYQHTIVEAKGYLVEVTGSRELPLTQLQPLNKPLLDVLVHYLNLTESFPESPSEQLDEKLEKLASAGEFYGMFLLKYTPDGRYVVVGSSLSEYLGKDYTNFFKLGDLHSPEVKERGYINYISFDSATNQPFFIVAHPVYHEGRPIGVLAISDNISGKLSQLLTPDRHLYEVKFALMLPSSVVFAASDPDLRFQYFFPLKPEYRQIFTEEEPLAKTRLAKDPLEVDPNIGYPFFEFDWGEKTQIGYLKELPGENFSILSYASKDEIFSVPLRAFLSIFGVYAIILIAGGIIATILTKRMAKPIQNLSSVMLGIQKGDLDLRYQRNVLGFEINKLGHLFNEMIDTVIEKKHFAEEQRVKRETLAQELRLGQQVQRSLLPQTMPVYPGVELAETYIPAIEVGGDFYDVFTKDEGELVLSVADASGKGVQACFYSLSVRNMLRTYAREYDDVALAMTSANNLFCHDTGDTGMFVTVLMGIYDARTHLFRYYSCGHNPPMVRRVDGRVEVLDHLGISMGFRQLESAEGHSTQLNCGDTLVLYTDGITEAHNVDNQLYGEKRLSQCLEKEGHRTASELVKAIVDDVNHFVGKAHQHDDITLLVMKVTE